VAVRLYARASQPLYRSKDWRKEMTKREKEMLNLIRALMKIARTEKQFKKAIAGLVGLGGK
jgi:hypothetical protein